MTRETYLQGIPRLSKRISCFLAVRHTLPTSSNKKFPISASNLQNFGRVGGAPCYRREAHPWKTYLQEILRLSERIPCFLAVKHTIPASSDERFPRTTTKLQSFWSRWPILEAATLLPARESPARFTCKGFRRFLNLFHDS